MSYLSDPDRLERLAFYLRDDSPNTTTREVSDALDDAAVRIRSNQTYRPRSNAFWYGVVCGICIATSAAMFMIVTRYLGIWT